MHVLVLDFKSKKKKHKENIAFKFKYGSFILFSWAKTDEESCTFD